MASSQAMGSAQACAAPMGCMEPMACEHTGCAAATEVGGRLDRLWHRSDIVEDRLGGKDLSMRFPGHILGGSSWFRCLARCGTDSAFAFREYHRPNLGHPGQKSERLRMVVVRRSAGIPRSSATTPTAGSNATTPTGAQHSMDHSCSRRPAPRWHWRPTQPSHPAKIPFAALRRACTREARSCCPSFRPRTVAIPAMFPRPRHAIHIFDPCWGSFRLNSGWVSLLNAGQSLYISGARFVLTNTRCERERGARAWRKAN